MQRRAVEAEALAKEIGLSSADTTASGSDRRCASRMPARLCARQEAAVCIICMSKADSNGKIHAVTWSRRGVYVRVEQDNPLIRKCSQKSSSVLESFLEYIHICL